MGADAFENKYQAAIDETVKRMGSSTMAELWVELDKIKEQMAEEIEKGICLGGAIETAGNQMDGENAGGAAG